MIDAHTHILPYMDDGAADVKEARRMLVRAAGQGISLICLTPHYYHGKEPLADFYQKRESSLQEISGCAAGLNITLLLGSETYLTADLLNVCGIDGLCIGRSRCLLLEVPLACTFSHKTLQLIERVMSNFNVTPVIAHIERYPPLLHAKSPLPYLLDMGCLMQINLCSMNSFFLRRTLLRYFKGEKIHFVGTDCHDLTTRPPAYGNLELLRKWLGAPFVDEFQTRMRELLVK